MPIYVFECECCNNTFEDLVSRGIELQCCPKCNGNSKKIIARSNYSLKGGGWKNTGYEKVPDPTGIHQFPDGRTLACLPIYGNTPKNR